MSADRNPGYDVYRAGSNEWVAGPFATEEEAEEEASKLAKRGGRYVVGERKPVTMGSALW